MLGSKTRSYTQYKFFTESEIHMTEIQETEVTDTTQVVREVPFGQRRTTVVKVAAPKDYEAKRAIFRTYQVIWYVLGVIEVLLAFRVFLKLLGANTYSSFTTFIYGLSSIFSQPFAGILGISSNSGMVFEWSTIIAMAVYAVLAYGLVALFQLVKPTNPQEVDESIENQ